MFLDLFLIISYSNYSLDILRALKLMLKLVSSFDDNIWESGANWKMVSEDFFTITELNFSNTRKLKEEGVVYLLGNTKINKMKLIHQALFLKIKYWYIIGKYCRRNWSFSSVTSVRTQPKAKTVDKASSTSWGDT